MIAAKEAIGTAVSKGYLGWSSRGTLKVKNCRVLATAVKLGPQSSECKCIEEREIEYPKADAY